MWWANGQAHIRDSERVLRHGRGGRLGASSRGDVWTFEPCDSQGHDGRGPGGRAVEVGRTRLRRRANG